MAAWIRVGPWGGEKWADLGYHLQSGSVARDFLEVGMRETGIANDPPTPAQLRNRPGSCRLPSPLQPPAALHGPSGASHPPTGPWHVSFAAGLDCCHSPGSHGNTLPLPPAPPSSQTGPGPNNAPQPASGLDTMPLFRFIASSRRPAGFPGLFGIYITLASSRDFFVVVQKKKKKEEREGEYLRLLLSEYLNIL